MHVVYLLAGAGRTMSMDGIISIHVLDSENAASGMPHSPSELRLC